MKALQIKNLTKIYDNNLVALDDISFEVEQGDFYALLGPNGAGKSTMIGIISSLVNKSSGKVNILGLDIDTHHSEAKKRIGIVGQEVNFNQFETVHNILLHQAGFFGMPFSEIKNNCEFYLKRLDLWDKRNEQGRNLSGGMKRRLMVAKALINNPDLLILDEPTAGVDIELRRSLWDFLIEINNNGTTIILTTHYLEEAERLCKNLSIVHKGEIVQNSPMRDIIASKRKHTYIIRTDSTINDINAFGDNIINIDNNSYELTVDNKVSISEIINSFNNNKINVIEILSKRNKLEELFMELTQE